MTTDKHAHVRVRSKTRMAAAQMRYAGYASIAISREAFIMRTNWLGVTGIAAFAAAAALACSSSSSPTEKSDAAADATGSSGSSSSSGGAAEAGGTTATLTVMNFLDWCSVTINGGTASTGATVTAPVAVGSTATIVVTPASSAFTIGADPWFGVTQNNGGAAPGTDNGAGTTETSTATVVVSGAQCVSVCCAEPNNSPTPCPATNPCP